jgi:hypothetical protein
LQVNPVLFGIGAKITYVCEGFLQTEQSDCQLHVKLLELLRLLSPRLIELALPSQFTSPAFSFPLHTFLIPSGIISGSLSGHLLTNWTNDHTVLLMKLFHTQALPRFRFSSLEKANGLHKPLVHFVFRWMTCEKAFVISHFCNLSWLDEKVLDFLLFC